MISFVFGNCMIYTGMGEFDEEVGVLTTRFSLINKFVENFFATDRAQFSSANSLP